MKLNTDTIKETINSLCLSLHNHRSITFESKESVGTHTGRITEMDGQSFRIDSKDWSWDYSDITSIEMI